MTAPGLVFSGPPTTIHGTVVLRVRAERRSRIRVLESGRLVASGRATGDAQSISFSAADGTHTYAVEAVDAADNITALDDATVRVDGTAPARPALTLSAARGLLAYTTATIAGEPLARYTARFIDRGGSRVITQRGTLDDSGQAMAKALVPNGSYLTTVTLTDAGQNTSPAAQAPVAVNLPAPTLRLSRSSAVNSSSTVVELIGPAMGAGTLVFEEDGPTPVSVRFRLDEQGHGNAVGTLSDGDWVAQALVDDFQHRRAKARLSGLLVDTVAPALLVKVNGKAAKNRRAVVDFEVEPGATVTVEGLPGGEQTFDQPGPARIDRRLRNGGYKVRFSATDLAGNETVLTRTIKVSHPLTLTETLTILAVFAGLGTAGFLLARARWRRRFETRAKREARRLTRAYNQQVAAHHALVEQHTQAMSAHHQAVAAWEREGERLAHIAAEARNYNGYDLDLPAGVKPRPGEVMFAHMAKGGLVELRRPHGVDVPSVVEQGEIWVTGSRILFEGSKRREWSFDRLEALQHLGDSQTLMQVSNRQKPSGIAYTGSQPDQVRRHIGLAHATFAGTRATVVQATDAAVVQHTGARPKPPAPLPAAPVPPVLPTAEDLRAEAAARKGRTPLPAQ